MLSRFHVAYNSFPWSLLLRSKLLAVRKQRWRLRCKYRIRTSAGGYGTPRCIHNHSCSVSNFYVNLTSFGARPSTEFQPPESPVRLGSVHLYSGKCKFYTMGSSLSEPSVLIRVLEFWLSKSVSHFCFHNRVKHLKSLKNGPVWTGVPGPMSSTKTLSFSHNGQPYLAVEFCSIWAF